MHITNRTIKILIMAVAMTVSSVFLSSATAAEDSPPLEALNISYWPEYDQPEVLVMYRGRLDSSVELPATIRFKIPKGVRVAATSAVDDSGQFQYDRAWQTHEVKPAGAEDELTYETTHKEFQFEIYMNPVKSNEKRDFNFDYTSTADVKSLGVEIQKPQRAENFKVTPTAEKTSDNDGFENHLYSFGDVKVGQKFAFEISYDKADASPSKQNGPGAASPTAGSSSTALVVILALMIGGGLAAAWRFKSTATARPVPRASSGPRKIGGKKKSGGKGGSRQKNFCLACGSVTQKDSKFCGSCGASV